MVGKKKGRWSLRQNTSLSSPTQPSLAQPTAELFSILRHPARPTRPNVVPEQYRGSSKEHEIRLQAIDIATIYLETIDPDKPSQADYRLTRLDLIGLSCLLHVVRYEPQFCFM